MLISYDDVRRYAPRAGLFCVFATFVMNASSNDARAVFITVPCALMFLCIATIYLDQKSQAMTLQSQVIAACTFTLFGFGLGSDYVVLNFTTGVSNSIYTADVVLLCVSFGAYIMVWLE